MRRFGRSLVMGLGSLVIVGSVALAQDDTTPSPSPSAPPSIAGELNWKEAVKDLLAKPAGKAILALGGLVVIFTVVRVAITTREKARRSALSGGTGVLANMYAKGALERLVHEGKFDEAAELVIAQGQGGGGPPGDATREIEAAELFLRAKRFQKAAEIFVRKGKLRRAGEAYERAQQPDLAAELYEKAGELERADECYGKAKNKAAAARMWAQAGKHEKAAPYYAEVGRPKEAAEQYERANLKQEALAKYLETFTLVSAQNPTRGERVLGLDTEAKEVFEKISKLYEEVQDWEGYAQFLVKNGRAEAAAEMWKRAGRLDKAAELLRSTGKWDAAGKLLEETGAHRDAVVLRAQGHQDRGELEQAAELYLKVGEFLIAAENYEKLGKEAKAAEIYEKNKDPRRAADLYAKVGDYKRAAALYETTKQWNAAVFCFEQDGNALKVAECWEHLGNPFFAGVSWFVAHETQKAIAALRKVPKDHEDRREAVRLLGILLHETNHDQDALALFEEGFGHKIQKDDVESFYYCAQTFERIPTEHQKAISAYETILKLRPGYRDVEKRLAAIKAGQPLPKTSIYKDGLDDPGSLFHTSRFHLRKGSEKARPTGRTLRPKQA